MTNSKSKGHMIDISSCMAAAFSFLYLWCCFFPVIYPNGNNVSFINVNLKIASEYMMLFFIGIATADRHSHNSTTDNIGSIISYGIKASIAVFLFVIARVVCSQPFSKVWVWKSIFGLSSIGNNSWILTCGWIMFVSMALGDILSRGNALRKSVVPAVLGVAFSFCLYRIRKFAYGPLLAFYLGVFFFNAFLMQYRSLFPRRKSFSLYSGYIGILLCGRIFMAFLPLTEWVSTKALYMLTCFLVCFAAGSICDQFGEIMGTIVINSYALFKIDFNQYRRYEFLFSELVKRDFKKKYKRTVLGMFWSVLYPVMILLVMRMVFTQFFGRTTPHYTTYLFCGNLIFSYFSEATTQGMTALTVNASIFSKTNMPKSLFVLSKNVQTLINFAATILVFFLFCAFDEITFTWKFITLLYPIVCLLIFNVGVGMILSALFVFFKDAQYLWSIFTRLLMYVSAIFYSIEGYPENIQYMFLLNPVYLFIRYFRKVVIDGIIPTPAFHLLMLSDALMVLGFGIWIYKKYDDEFMYYI